MLRVFVALGKQLPKNKAMIEDTQEVGRLLAKYNCTLVQGGARTGLMGEVVSEFQKYSDEVVMIVPEVHKSDLEGTTSKEHYIVEGEADRLKITINTCDLIVVLPGGTGTMAELSFYNETCKSGEHSAKIVMLNTKGFYNKLFNFIKHQTKLGFMKKEDFKFEVINNTKQLELIIQQLLTTKQVDVQDVDTKQDLVEDMNEVVEVKKLEAKKPVKKSSKTEKAVKEPKVKMDMKVEVVVDADKLAKEQSKSTKTTKQVKKSEPKKATTKVAPNAKSWVAKVTKTTAKAKDVASKPASEAKTAKSTPTKKATSVKEQAKTTKDEKDAKPVAKATSKSTTTKKAAKTVKIEKPVAKKTTKK